MTPQHFILIGRTPIAVDFMTWADWFENHVTERLIARDAIDGVEISTVFLGLDHNFSRYGDPVLFETMVFNGPLDQSTWRCCTYQQAEVMHATALEVVRAAPRDGVRKIAELVGARLAETRERLKK